MKSDLFCRTPYIQVCFFSAIVLFHVKISKKDDKVAKKKIGRMSKVGWEAMNFAFVCPFSESVRKVFLCVFYFSYKSKCVCVCV